MCDGVCAQTHECYPQDTVMHRDCPLRWTMSQSRFALGYVLADEYARVEDRISIRARDDRIEVELDDLRMRTAELRLCAFPGASRK